MWPDRVSNPGPLTYLSGALPTALRGPASDHFSHHLKLIAKFKWKQLCRFQLASFLIGGQLLQGTIYSYRVNS